MPYKEFNLTDIGRVKVYKRRTNRSLRLTIAADGNVRVTIPLWAPYGAGMAFVRAKRAWILSQSRSGDNILTDGLKIGKSHRLKFNQTRYVVSTRSIVQSTEVIITHGIQVGIHDSSVQSVARSACIRALRLQATSLLSQRLEQMAHVHDFSYQSLSIKLMKSRWGSCDSQRNIVLNLYLIQLPWKLIDYVIMHELTHTTVLHHGSDFWHALEAVEPDARELRKAIKAYHPTLLIA